MKTKEQLIDWLKNREKETLSMQYDLIDFLNEPEIDRSIRALRGHFWDFEQKLNTVRRLIEDSIARGESE